MSYLENGRAQESIVRQRAYSAPQIGITESLQSPGIVTPGPVSYGAAIADDLLRTLSLAGQAAQVGVQIQREQQAERARLERERAADFAARMKMQDEADKANQSEVLGMATRDANTIQARLVNELKTGRLAIDDTRDPEAIAADLIGSELPENASNIYATKMYNELIRPLTEAVVSARTAVQENERKSISTNLSNAVFGAKSVDDVNAAMAEASAKGVDPQAVLTNGVQALATIGDRRAIEYASAIVDPESRAAVIVSARKEADRIESEKRLGELNDLSLRIQNAGNDLGTLTALRGEVMQYQSQHPEARATVQSFADSLKDRINGIADSAIKASVEQKEAEFKQIAAAGHMASLTAAVESGQGYAMLDGAEQTSTITYTKADGTTETKEVKYTATQADAERTMLAVIDQKARAVAGNDPVVYRRTRLNEVRKNAMVDPDLSRIASAGISKLSEYAAQEGAAFPPESIEGFSVYLDSLDIAPNAIRLGASEANIYAVAAQALDTPIVAGNPQDAETKARALSFAIRSIKRPDAGKLSEKMTAQFVSAARSVTAELLDGNLDEEGRVADVAQFIKDRASFYYVTGDPVRMTPEKAIDAAKQDAAKYGRKVNGHWTMTYTEMPVAGNGKPLNENMGLLAEAMARDYGVYNSVDESWWPGESKMGRADVKFTQLPSGRWVVTDSRNPYPTSITINRNGDRMPELSSAELISRVNAMVNDRIISDNAGVVDARTSTNPTLRAMVNAPAGALGDTYRLPFQTNQ